MSSSFLPVEGGWGVSTGSKIYFCENCKQFGINKRVSLGKNLLFNTFYLSGVILLIYLVLFIITKTDLES